MTTYVFAGPTLSPLEAPADLDAIWLPPVAQGDVLRIGLRRPYAIGIVDGYFDGIPAVWHKEILWAMAQGIHVFGAGSMGALRAAELAPFGMVGIGKVFEAFRDGILEDDDEVAVVHEPRERGYRATSEAMVNIRETLAHAADASIVSDLTRLALEGAAKALFYPERSYPRLLDEGTRLGLPAAQLDALRAWLPGGRVDRKREDALDMLRAIGDQRLARPEAMRVTFVLEHTKFWDRALASAGVAADALDGSVDMVAAAGVLDELRLDPVTYGRLRREALLHHLLVSEAIRRGCRVNPEDSERAAREFMAEHGLDTKETFHAWLMTNQMSAQQFSALIEERVLIRMVLARLREEASSRIVELLRLSGGFATLLKRAAEKERALAHAGAATLPQAGDDVSDEFVLDWFLKRLGAADERTVEGHAAVLEYAHQNLNAFLRTARREYHYLAVLRDGAAETKD